MIRGRCVRITAESFIVQFLSEYHVYCEHPLKRGLLPPFPPPQTANLACAYNKSWSPSALQLATLIAVKEIASRLRQTRRWRISLPARFDDSWTSCNHPRCHALINLGVHDRKLLRPGERGSVRLFLGSTVLSLHRLPGCRSHSTGRCASLAYVTALLLRKSRGRGRAQNFRHSFRYVRRD